MDINLLAILIAAVVQFIVGAIWYMPIFGKTWGKIHGFDMVPAEEQAQMMKGMWKLLVVQFISTLVMTTVLAIFITSLPADWNVYALAGFFWLGFILTTQISAVLFGGTKPEWVLKKIAIMAVEALIRIELAAIIIKSMM
jgi:hypothetical protein